MELNEIEKKVNIDELSTEQLEDLSKHIGETIRSITDEAAQKVNAILNLYGMSAKIAISFGHEKITKVPKKRGRKPKVSKGNNL